MGGATEPIAVALKDSYSENAELGDAVGGFGVAGRWFQR
jgi:hypothetical protein